MCEHIASSDALKGGQLQLYTFLSLLLTMLSHVVLQFLFSVCSLTMLSQVQLQHSVCSLIMLSQVVLQFLFQLAFDHALSGCIRVSFVTCCLIIQDQL